jgi:hypothetical protein
MSAQKDLDGKAQTQRLERLLSMGTRLAGAIEGDIAALNKGAFDQLHTTDPEISNLALLYRNEVTALKKSGGVGKGAPAVLVSELKSLGKRLKKSLSRHEQLVMAMRQASEGLVQAVAEEVEKSRARTATYSAQPRGTNPGPSGAIVYNKVV